MVVRVAMIILFFFFFFQAEDGIRDIGVTGVQTCALPIFIRIQNWCFDNYLLPNAPKPKLMLFGNNRMISRIPNFRLSLLGKELLPVTSAKDLG